MEGKFTNGEFEGKVQKPAKQKKGKQDAWYCTSMCSKSTRLW